MTESILERAARLRGQALRLRLQGGRLAADIAKALELQAEQLERKSSEDTLQATLALI